MDKFRIRRIFILFLGILLISINFIPLYIPKIVENKIISSTKKNYNIANNNYYRLFDLKNKYYILYQDKEDNYDANLYDLEHIYCLSWVNNNQVKLYDPFNLRLSLKIVNSTRGNNYFGNVKNKDKAKKIIYNQEIVGYIDYTNKIFEPVYDKGDITRAILYMHTVYSLPYPYISTMREWAIKYKPQEDEIHHYKKVISQTNQNNILINKYYLSRFII